MSSFAVRFMNSSIVMSFILHPLVVRLLVVPFECVNLDVLRQKNDLSVTCGSEEHLRWLALSSMGLVIYGLGTPIVLFLILFRVRHRLLLAEVRKRFGFLYNGFELRFYYFESVYMLRKVVILLFFSAPTMYVRMILLLIASVSFILVHMRTEPFDNRSYRCLDNLESLNLGALLVTVVARLIFDLQQDMYGQDVTPLSKGWFLAVLLVAVPLLTHAAFVAFAAWSLFRNTVLKHLTLKAEIWPEKMTRFQRCLLGLEKRAHKATYGIDDGGLWIDTEQLSQQERRYLQSALCDTLKRYHESSNRVHPADLAAAAEEALQRSRRTRRRRAVRLEQLAARQTGRGSVAACFRWIEEMRLSLQSSEADGCCGPLETLCKALQTVGRCLCSRFRGTPWPDRPVDAEAGPASGPRIVGLPCRALHLEIEHCRDFTVEEFYDALMPVWLEIIEGIGPRLPSEQRFVTAISESTVNVLPREQQPAEDFAEGESSESCKADNDSPVHVAAEEPKGSKLSEADLVMLQSEHDLLLAENRKLLEENQAFRRICHGSDQAGAANAAAVDTATMWSGECDERRAGRQGNGKAKEGGLTFVGESAGTLTCERQSQSRHDGGSVDLEHRMQQAECFVSASRAQSVDDDSGLAIDEETGHNICEKAAVRPSRRDSVKQTIHFSSESRLAQPLPESAWQKPWPSLASLASAFSAAIALTPSSVTRLPTHTLPAPSDNDRQTKQVHSQAQDGHTEGEQFRMRFPTKQGQLVSHWGPPPSARCDQMPSDYAHSVKLSPRSSDADRLRQIQRQSIWSSSLSPTSPEAWPRLQLPEDIRTQSMKEFESDVRVPAWSRSCPPSLTSC